jgi:hypothetical protein
MPNFRKISASAYMVAFLLVSIPFFDVAVTLAPWHPSISQWRFGALGLTCNALMIPAAGGLVAVVTAVMSEMERTRKWIGRVSWLMAILCVIAIMVFALDAVQASPKIVPAMMLSYRISVITATIKWFFGALTFALFGMACGIPAPRTPKPAAQPAR